MFDVQVYTKMTRTWLNDYFEFSSATIIQNTLQMVCSGLFRWKVKFSRFIVSLFAVTGASASACAGGARLWFCYCFRCCYFFPHWYTIFHCQPTKQILCSIVMHSGNLFKLKEFQWRRANFLHWLIFEYAVNVQMCIKEIKVLFPMSRPNIRIYSHVCTVHSTRHTVRQITTLTPFHKIISSRWKWDRNLLIRTNGTNFIFDFIRLARNA